MSISTFRFVLNLVLNSVAKVRKAKSHAFCVVVAQIRKAQGHTARVNKAAKRLAAWQQQVAVSARRTRGTKTASKAVRPSHRAWTAAKVARRSDRRAAVVTAIAARKPVLRVRVEVAPPVLKQERATRNLAALQTSCEIVGGCYLKAVARRSTRPQPKKTWEDFRAQAEMVVFKSVEDLMNAVASATGHPATSYAQGATMSLSLTDSQKAVYDKAVDFINGNAGQFLRLEGYAGTGKSFTTAEIIKYATNKGIAVAACSPTNKASFNLNNMLVNAGCKVEATTLAKLLGVKQDRSNGTGSFKRDEKKSTMHFYNLVIVDEFSMVSKEYAEVLLTVAKDCGAKILFVGDPAQLPPVNEKITSVIALVPNVVSLTEVLRYSGEVARAAEEIRNNLLYTNQTYLFDTSEDGTIVRFNKQEFDANLPVAFANFKYLPNDNRILVWRNDTAAAYNQMVREYIFGAAIEQINVDDCIILNEPIKGFFNSEELIVIRNYGITTDKYDIRSYQLEVKSLFSGKVSIINVCLDEDDSKRMTQLMALTQNAREQGGRAWKPYYDLKESYANYNFAYALTVHKAQGSTVANTYIIVDDFQGCRESKQNLQYTALTRTGKTAYVLQEGSARQVASSVSTSAQTAESNKTPAVEALTSTAERPCDDVKPATQETKTYSNHSMNNHSEILAVQNSITALDNLAWDDIRQLPKSLGFKLEACAKYNKANILEAARKFYAAQLHELYQEVTVVEPAAIVSTVVEVEIETAPEVVIEVKQLVVVSDYSTEELGVEEVIVAAVTPVEMLAKSEQGANLEAMFGSTLPRYLANYPKKGKGKALDHDTDTLATACVGFIATVRNSRSMELPPVVQKAMQNRVTLIVPEAYETKIPCVDLLRAAMVFPTTQFADITGRINWSNEADSKLFAELRKSTEKALEKAKYTKSDISAVLYDLTIAAFFRKKGTAIVVPAYLTKYFVELGGEFTCFHPVDTNWVMPATGIIYDELLSAFERIESRIQRCGKFGETLATRPLTVVKGNKAFEVLFGADFKIRVEKKGIAFIYELDKEQSHTFKQVLFAAHCDNRRNHASEVVVMSGIDQIFYLFENYLLLDLNRKYSGNAFAECPKFHQSARQFILNHAKIDSAIGYYENAARIQFSSDTATAVVGAMVGYFTYAGGFYKKGSIVGRNVMSITATKRDKSTMDFTQYLNDIAFKASLTEANKANTRKVIAAANEHGMAILAYGGMNLLQNKYLVKDLSLLQRDKAVYVIKGIVKHHWVKWGFAEKLGGATDVNIAKALMSCKAIADAVGDVEIGSARFWDIVATVKVALSTKESKLFKRLASDFSQNMRGVNEQSARLRKTGDTFVPTTTAIKAIIGKQIAIDPGIALSNGDLAYCGYTENGRNTRHYNSVGEGFITFEEKFELAARPLGTIGYDFSGVVKRSGGILAENLGVPVVKGEVIGFIHTRIQGGEVVLSTALVAESTGSLMKAIIRDVKNLSGEYYTTVLLVYEKKTDVLKLRFAQKSNVVKSNFALLFDFSPAVSHCEIFVPQDAYKGDDNFNHPWTIIAETFCRTKEGSVLRNAILEANQILYPECVTSDIFHWDLTLALMGKYEFLLDLYYANFRKSVWFHDRSMQSGYTRIMSMHHNSPAWRQVAANEEFSGKENFSGQSNYVMFTDAAAAEITDTDVVLVTWQETVDGNTMYHTATRGMCYMGTEETPLYLPCNIEYISIEQATSVTRTPPNVLVALGVRGYKDVAADMIEASKSKNASDKVLFALLNNVSLTSNGIKATTVDLFRSGVSSSSLLTEEQLENLEAIQDSRGEWFELLSFYLGNYVFTLVDSSWAEVSVHLPTFYKLGGKGLSNAGESITSKVCDYFWLWMAGESCSADCLQAVAKDIRVMLGNFLDGESQVKGQTRAGDALYQAAAALSCIPSDELWVLESHKDLYTKVLGKGIENGYVGTTRMPMTRLACLKMRFISDADNQYLWDTYGYEIQPWRAYFGTGMMYLNWGDLDGDKIAIVNLTKYVRHYGLPVDNFESMLWTVRETLGYDMLSKEWWLSNKPAQYFGDHFQILPWKKVAAKAGLKIEKSFMTQTSYVEFQEAAFDVQTKGVGCTYKIATIHAMLAEVLPLVMSRYPNAEWANSFKYLLQADGAHLFANRLEQIYEVCLGGYGKEAAMAVMGYLLRACNGDTDDTAWTNLPEVAKKLGFGGSFGSVVPGASDLLRFSAVPVEGKGNVDDCLEELGFNAADRQKFLTAAMVAGVCAKMGDFKEDKLALLPVELQLVFSVVQALLDVSQAKEVKAMKNGDKNPKETANFNLVADILKGGAVAELYQLLKEKTVTFQLFSNFASNRQAKQYALKTGVMEIGGALFTEVPVDEDDQDDDGGNVVAPLNPSSPSDNSGETEEVATPMTRKVQPEVVVTVTAEEIATPMVRKTKSSLVQPTEEQLAILAIESATDEVVESVTEIATPMVRKVKSTVTAATSVVEVVATVTANAPVAVVVEELATRMTRNVKPTMTPATPVVEVEVVLEVKEVEPSLAELVEESLAAGYSEEETFSDLIAMGYKAKEVIVTIAQFIS